MDKLDKTIEELQKGSKKKKVVDKTPIVDIFETARQHPEIISEEIDREIVEKIEEDVKNQHYEYIETSKITQTFQEEIKQVGFKDTYLPFVLTKLGICGINTEARKLIMSGKVKINSNVVGLTFNTKELSNFLLEVNGVKYEIFKID